MVESRGKEESLGDQGRPNDGRKTIQLRQGEIMFGQNLNSVTDRCLQRPRLRRLNGSEDFLVAG